MTQTGTFSETRRPWWLIAATLVLVLGTLGFGALIAAGVFDPQPAGPIAAAFAPDDISVEAGDEVVVWQSGAFIDPSRAQTWQLNAAHSGGEVDSGYGLILGDDEHALVVAISPLGYTAVWERDVTGGQQAVRFPWQPWPHVSTGDGINEIWVDVVPQGGNRNQVNVRVNREHLWSGEVDRIMGQAGTWAASFGEPASVDFEALTQFASPAMEPAQ